MNDETKHQDLRIRTKKFSLRIIEMFVDLPKNEVAKILGRQVLRSGTSVGANYREGYRARSKPEFISKLGDSLKELEETTYWLELLTESGTVPPPKLAPLLQETNELTAILTTIVKRAKSSPS